MNREERQKYVLQWVNRQRKACGVRATSRLKKGYPGNPRLCVIAESLACVGVRWAAPAVGPGFGKILLSDGGSGTWYDEPEIAKFMRDFDAGLYPDLVIPPTPVKINRVVVG